MTTTPAPVRRHRTTLALAAATGAAALALTALAPAGPADAGDDARPSGATHRAAQRLEAVLRPSGDPDGSGEAHLTLNQARGRVCATITWQDVATPDSAHVHRRSDGQVVVDLSDAVTGGPRCTTGVGHRTIGRILAHPRRYYVNVHNATYPAGAIQGTLHR
ncbi:CHRD domain-containing protein [Nocardioides sp. KIGAM211]|uniref:CHRD domain-containing protein n=1 Tax=Nocardioides luti TaxID=2761101 RepID=A0A7X0RJ74_9ACTN|nr:CHRD domain-containing protein [Nocardioides luti]MBB6629132.1 CHRD domain-containing protein [Nocardioides luti]